MTGPDVPLTRAVGLLQTGRPDKAAELFRRFAADAPDNDGRWHLLGLAWALSNASEPALTALRRAVRLAPTPNAAENLATAATQTAALCPRRPDADALAEFAVAWRPDRGESWTARAVVAEAQRDDPALLVALTRAVRLAGSDAAAWSRLVHAHRVQGRAADARAAGRRGLAVDPAHAEIWENLGHAALSENRFDDAERIWRRAVQLRPDAVRVRFNRALLLLADGRWTEGWTEYETRFAVHGVTPSAPLPRWRGEPIEGRTLLVEHEQGLGDLIQFVRYVPLLERRGASVIVNCPPSMHRLLSTLPGSARFSAPGAALPRVPDWSVPLLGLPGLFGTTPSTVPAAAPYLAAERDLVRRWRTVVAGDRPVVGVAWKGSAGYGADARRSLPVSALAALARTPGVRFVSLNRGVSKDAAGLGIATPEGLDDGPDAFLDTAALMEELDLVVSVDTSIAHLAGALARPVWILLGLDPDWRWLRDRSDTPWYPTARLFRQTADGGWLGVVAEVTAALARLTAGNP